MNLSPFERMLQSVDPVLTATVATDPSESHHRRLAVAAKYLRECLGRLDIRLSVSDDWFIRNLAIYYAGAPDQLKTQDPASKRAVELVQRKADELQAALSDAFAIAEEPAPGDLLNLAALFFGDDDDDLLTSAVSLRMRAAQVLRMGQPIGGRGRPTNIAYYSFVRTLHDLFVICTGTKGFSRKGSSAEGAFIDLVCDAQQILPDGIRLSERDTIANRVVAQKGKPDKGFAQRRSTESEPNRAPADRP